MRRGAAPGARGSALIAALSGFWGRNHKTALGDSSGAGMVRSRLFEEPLQARLHFWRGTVGLSLGF